MCFSASAKYLKMKPSTSSSFRRVVFIVAAAASSLFAQEHQKRMPTLDDFFRFQEVSEIAISPDGQLVAYTLNRVRGEGSEPHNPYENSFPTDFQIQRD